MCGRYGFTPDKDFVDEFEIENRGETKWHQSVNIPPGSTNPIVTMNSPKHLHMAHWGLIPPWAKDKKIGFATINARSEEAESKPMFRTAYKKGRCLVPMTSYLEFAHLKSDPKTKIPYAFKVKKAIVFAVAGLYSLWRDPESDSEIYTYSILTTHANDLGATIHSRMPCILHQKDWDTWADNSHFDSVTMKSLLNPFPAKDMDAWPVSRDINNPRNNDPELLDPVDEVPITPSKPAWEEKKK